MKKAKIATIWSTRTYDVWGNAKEGYDVNDVFSGYEVQLDLEIKTYNVGTPQEFQAAYPTHKQLRMVFGVRCQIETDGEDTFIYVRRTRDWYPIGEMYCESHESLSPIREKGAKA